MARVIRALRARDDGMTTAEYCIGTVAACAFAAALYEVLSGNWINSLIKGVLSHALHLIGL
ncbi:MAG TPA: DUF4244 domain-containing protein [Mycobacteriales bacterium]|nr:DUF4244 domain-containing protein [Mycobacteriales bacterium]HWA67547.1 DUF4244 domain-containing protein [Mycobacteriales bacterium]